MPTQLRQPEVSAEAAYEAATARALRTTEALIATEAQNLDLRRQLAEMTERCDKYATEAGKAAASRARRRIRDRARRVRRAEAGEGVDDGEGEGDPVGYTAAVGQAD